MSFASHYIGLLPGTGCEIKLPFPPLVESWERRDHPSQLRLAQYRHSIAALASPVLEQFRPPLALGFYVAGRPDMDTSCDLDNFLTPIVKALGGGDAFSLVWAIRGEASEAGSLTLLETADTRPDFAALASHVSTRLSVSATRPEWKTALAYAVGQHQSAHGQGSVASAFSSGFRHSGTGSRSGSRRSMPSAASSEKEIAHGTHAMTASRYSCSSASSPQNSTGTLKSRWVGPRASRAHAAAATTPCDEIHHQ